MAEYITKKQVLKELKKAYPLLREGMLAETINAIPAADVRCRKTGAYIVNIQGIEEFKEFLMRDSTTRIVLYGDNGEVVEFTRRGKTDGDQT